MTTNTKRVIWGLAWLGAAALQGCGGGGDGGAPASEADAASSVSASIPATPETTSPDSTSPSTETPPAGYVAGPRAGFHMIAPDSSSVGTLDGHVQAANGEMTTVDDYVLSGDFLVKDISQDTHHALGRWVAGTATSRTGTVVLTGADDASYHYYVLNAPMQLPAAGSASCDAGTFTTPTYSGWAAGQHTAAGIASGSMNLQFTAGGVVTAGAIVVSVDGASLAVQLDSTVKEAGEPGFTTDYRLLKQTSAVVQFGEGGPGAYVIGVGYTAEFSPGVRYVGVAKFRCS